MKKLIALVLLAASSAAFATQPVAGQQQQQTATSNGQSTVEIGCLVNCGEDTTSRDLTDRAIAADNNATALEIARINSDIKVRNTPSVSGSPLVSSNDTCMGSASGAVNVPGFGIGLGKTYVDDNCMMLKNSRELWNMGMKAASLALMCNDAKNKAALELTGFECPQTTAAKKAEADRKRASAPQSGGSGYAATYNSKPVYTGNDQIVIDRLAKK